MAEWTVVSGESELTISAEQGSRVVVFAIDGHPLTADTTTVEHIRRIAGAAISIARAERTAAAADKATP